MKYKKRFCLWLLLVVAGFEMVVLLCKVVFEQSVHEDMVNSKTLDVTYMLQEFEKETQRVEKNNAIQEQVKQQLVEQGYPEDAVEDLLIQGAQRAISLRNIASVKEMYGTPWNLPLYIGEYELVSLYLVGNEDSEKFVLGQYQDSTEEHVIFVHMSTTASLTTLQANLDYNSEEHEDNYSVYKDEIGSIIGFKFSVYLDENAMMATYVATGSDVFTQEDIDSFIGSVVDGTIL